MSEIFFFVPLYINISSFIEEVPFFYTKCEDFYESGVDVRQERRFWEPFGLIPFGVTQTNDPRF